MLPDFIMPDWPPPEGLPDLEGTLSLLPALGVGFEGVLAVGRDGVLLTLNQKITNLTNLMWFDSMRLLFTNLKYRKFRRQ